MAGKNHKHVSNINNNYNSGNPVINRSDVDEMYNSGNPVTNRSDDDEMYSLIPTKTPIS